jgi:hypothetical protein
MENILVNHVSDERLITKMYKEVTQLNSKGTHYPNKKCTKAQAGHSEISPKVYKCSLFSTSLPIFVIFSIIA